MTAPPYRAPPMKCSSLPPATVSSAPWVSAESLVRMLMTPLTALAPHTAAPGPRMTSMRSMSSSSMSWWSQYTPEKRGVYTLRPSTSTSSLLEKCWLKPRAETAQVLALI